MQLDLFNLGKERFVIDKPVRLIEIFAGVGSQAKALQRLGVEFEHYKVCEFDSYAIRSYNAIHGTNFKATDVTHLKGGDLGISDRDKYCYILTYSFPCTDLSMAGKRQGMARGDGTRSGLLWEVERLLTETEELPQVLLMENVPEVRRGENKEHFIEWVQFLIGLGYENYAQELNAKDYGIPQNRNRTFMVSLLDGYYTFPEPVELKERLRDRLEAIVHEKYYLSDEQVEKLLSNTFGTQKARLNDKEDFSNTICGDSRAPPCVDERKVSNFAPTIHNGGGVCKTIDTRIGAFSHTSQYLMQSEPVAEGV